MGVGGGAKSACAECGGAVDVERLARRWASAQCCAGSRCAHLARTDSVPRQDQVAHPGGLSCASLPVNSYEAESRRLTRFLQMGHTPGKMQVAPAQPSREFPFTLDLR